MLSCYIVTIYREGIEAARHHTHVHTAIDTVCPLVGILRLLSQESFTEDQNLLKEELCETLQYLEHLLHDSLTGESWKDVFDDVPMIRCFTLSTISDM
jgi:hypothetical protein